MSKARLVITAVAVEGRSQSEVARAYGVSQSWISRLVARYRAAGEAAFEPRSRRPHHTPTATGDEVVELILGLRKSPLEQGLDGGAHTIGWHLPDHHQTTVSATTIWRTLHATPRSPPSRGNGPARPTCGWKPPYPTRCGRPTPPTTGWPPARMWRS
jgi:transposase